MTAPAGVPPEVRLSVRPGIACLWVGILIAIAWAVASDSMLREMKDLFDRLVWLVVVPAGFLLLCAIGSVRVETRFIAGSPVFYRQHFYLFILRGEVETLPMEQLTSLEMRNAASSLSSSTPFVGIAYVRFAMVYLLMLAFQLIRLPTAYHLYANMEGYRHLLHSTADKKRMLEVAEYLSWYTGVRLE